MNQRQTIRRKRFEFLLAQMPFWETWITDHVEEIGYDQFNDVPILRESQRQHVKLIPRRVRRDMARKRMQREMRVVPA